MIFVLADDITGAAEIAGEAAARGLTTTLSTDIPAPRAADGRQQVTVVATDIRSGNATAAEEETTRLCRAIKAYCAADKGNRHLVFKKTDSVLRGHIRTELHTIMRQLGYNRSLLIAQNPSKGRIISNGIYYIGTTPLCDTAFSHDPEFPAHSPVAAELLGDGCRQLPTGAEMPSEADTIFIADATCDSDIERQLAKADKSTLIAGGADAFRAVLDKETGDAPTAAPQYAETPLANHDNTLLVVCGSTQSRPIAGEKAIRERHGTEVCIPDDVFEGAAPKNWIATLQTIWRERSALVLRVGNHQLKGATYAIRLRSVMAEATAAMAGERTPGILIIEGGATAFAALKRLGWHTFRVARQYAPGVVGMTHGGTHIILKPGSYPWGKLFE